MKIEGKRIGFVITGAFGTFTKVTEALKKMIEEKGEVLPIMSYNAYNTNSKFGTSKEWIEKIEQITREKNNSYYIMRRKYWNKTFNRYNDSCTSYWKHNC